MSYCAPERIGRQHSVDDFICSSDEQTIWLREYARQADAGGTARVFVVTEENSSAVVAYYGWCMASVELHRLPARMQQGTGKYAQPVALLTRLGVDIRHERKGLGASLLQDVFGRLLSLSDEIGFRGLLTHCETLEAMAFYRHLVPEFMHSPTDELHLLLLMKDIRRSLHR